MSKQDRQGARTPADLERRYDFRKSFSEVMGVARAAEGQAIKAQDEVKIVQGQMTEIQSDLDGVTLRVSATETVTGDLHEATEQLKEDMQTKATVQQLTEVKTAADGLRVTVSEVQTVLDGKADQVEVTEITEHFIFGAEGLTITNSGTGMGINVSEKKVGFSGGGDPTTVIKPNEMETTNLRVGAQLDLGKFSFIPRTNGNLSFRYTGG
jgi:hypothetical protein